MASFEADNPDSSLYGAIQMRAMRKRRTPIARLDEARMASPAKIKRIIALAGVILVLALVAVLSKRSRPQTIPVASSVNPVVDHAAFDEITGMLDDELQGEDIALLNLRCAEGLPGSESLEIDSCLKTLDDWADRVRIETQRNVLKFYAEPSEFKNSLAFYQMLMLVTVLQQDFGVHYDADSIREVDFSNSERLFVHGMLGGDGGTCVSMPVLYTAVARRLGYPVFLVNAKEHVFCRWDAPNERFNVEATNQGMNSHDDAHYMQWPHPISQSEVDQGLFLKSLTMSESLAAFLATRGHCFEDNGRKLEARNSYRNAVARAPEQPMYQGFFSQVSRPLRLKDFPALVRQQQELQKRLRNPNAGAPPVVNNTLANQPSSTINSSPGYPGFPF